MRQWRKGRYSNSFLLSQLLFDIPKNCEDLKMNICDTLGRKDSHLIGCLLKVMHLIGSHKIPSILRVVLLFKKWTQPITFIVASSHINHQSSLVISRHWPFERIDNSIIIVIQDQRSKVYFFELIDTTFIQNMTVVVDFWGPGGISCIRGTVSVTESNTHTCPGYDPTC